MKEKITNFREMLKNPRKKALFQLFCWFLFFAILYLVIIITPHPKPTYRTQTSTTTDTFTNFLNMDNFEYEYTFSYEDKKESISGTYFQEQYFFNYLGVEYYSKEGDIYQIDYVQKQMIESDNFILALSLRELSKETLYDWIINGELIEEKSYQDGKKIETYQYSIEENKSIIIVVTSNNYLVQSITIDLTDYFGTKELNYDSFQVELTYQEINNLTSYSKNYEDYEIVTGGE